MYRGLQTECAASQQYHNCWGIVPKSLGIMSVKLHFVSPADSSGINRSRSFTMQIKRTQVSSVSRNSPRSRLPSIKSTRKYASSQKNSNSMEPQPNRVEKICKSLRKGLNEYLETHQNELDLLNMQQKDMKRNSRLAFLYDLDKQIRTTERYIRKLEFHISKIEELYESYFIQWRLRNGASNMKQAYTVTPSTKGSRETLLKINRNYKECTEDMCAIERTLEVLLGEFHIRMKGLIGFARLCPGDHYEVLIKYGRQRWKLKGKIDADDRQTWDEEEMAFLPHINEDIEIKVAELKGLMTVLVGAVTCESADFFSTKPQIMIVDITDLGTIKLQLEITWDPFDNDDVSVTSGSISRFSLPSRKGSVYNWTPPSTPSFREKYLSHIGQEDTLPLLYHETKGHFIFNQLGNGHHNTNLSSVPENEKFYNYANTDKRRNSHCTNNTFAIQDPSMELSYSLQGGIPTERAVPSPYVESTYPKQKDSIPNKPFQSCSATAKSALHIKPHFKLQQSTGKSAEWNSTGHIRNADLTKPLGPQRTLTVFSTQRDSTLMSSGKNIRMEFISVNIGTILQEILIILRTDQRNHKELQRLEQQILHFRDFLKREAKDSSSASTVSLTVETVLESFNFLNTDSSEDNLSCSGSIRIKDERYGTYNKGNICQHALTKNGDLEVKAPRTLALTSENVCLDQVLLTHLQVCKRLLQRFTSTGCVPVLQSYILEELSQQILVLETLALICEKSQNIKSVEEVIPKSKMCKSVQSFWSKCMEIDSVLYSSAERFLAQLRNCYTQKVAARHPGQTERVFRTLLYQIVSCCELLLCPNVSEEIVTVFQFFNYVKKYNITQLGTHLTRLAKEVFLPEELQTAQKMKTLKKLKDKLVSELQPLHQTLQSICILQLDENPKIAQTVISFLRSASANNIFRAKALAYYTDTLREKDTQLQRAACIALKQLKAVESIEQIASLCHSQTANIRDTAKETLQSFGEKGRLAFEKVDILWYEEGMNQNSTTEITIL
ncbi:RIPOR family member 3 isoform X3 [Chiloscyllium plagiosum]|uniref:RIPOR family member 3 isoform X3 n=1 Tax=Chiloscyllium plagiosum TaxID=36176 RepID=UPI001CB7EA08|nr:RIPOR family member 3 isoform X3 [Chiloscyllium plagiosum]